MSKRIPVGLVGAGGYTGLELCRVLAAHPVFDLVRVTSRTDAGKTLAEMNPYFQGTKFGGLELVEPDAADLASACELAFLAVPHGAAMNTAAELLGSGLKVVDLSADFRLKDSEVYETWYNVPHEHAELLSKAVYGLPEIYSEDIKKADLVANPGCYPTSAILALNPALAQGLVSFESIVVDSKSGASGAGRKPGTATLFCEVHDSFRPYNTGKHRHTPEIEQELSKAAGRPLTIMFSPHLLPIDRGILTTVYCTLEQNLTTQDVHRHYTSYYRGNPWVRVLPPGRLPETRWVRGTMFCDIGLVADERTSRLVVASAIDNLCRGASGQAVANANLMTGQEVDAGLSLFPLMP